MKPKRNGKSCNPKSRNGGRRPSGKGKPDFKKEDRDTYKSRDSKPSDLNEGKEMNDPKWYMFNDTVTYDAANISYSNPLGIPTNEKTLSWGSYTDIIPNLMSIKFTPTLGVSTSPISPLNLQMRAIYSNLQARVSNTLPFAAADLGVHFGAIDSLYIMYSWCQRLYGVYNTYMAMNRQVPDVYFRSFGLNPTTMESQMSMISFKHQLNKIGIDLSRLFVPSGLKIFQRHSWMCTNIFTDDDDDKAQQYMFNPYGLWQYDPNGSTGGELELIAFPTTWTGGLAGVISWFRSLMAPIYNDKDVWMINAYILRGYGESGCFKLSVIEDGYRVGPTYVPEILPQIHNLDVVGNWDFSGSFAPRYTQSATDDIRWTPVLPVDAHTTGALTRGGLGLGYDESFILDQPMREPSYADNFIATRLMVSCIQYAQSTWPNMLITVASYGTEIVNNFTIYTTGDYGDPSSEITFTHLGIGCNGPSAQTATEYTIADMRIFAKLLKFKYGPMIRFTDDPSPTQTTWSSLPHNSWTWYFGELENYTLITGTDLMKLHDAATMGEWLIPNDFATNVK